MKDISKLIIVGSTALLVLGAVFCMLFVEARTRADEARRPSFNPTPPDAGPAENAEPVDVDTDHEGDAVVETATELPDTVQLPVDFRLPRAASLNEIVARYYASIRLHDGSTIPIRPADLPAIARRIAKYNGGIDPRAALPAGAVIELPRVYVVARGDRLVHIARKLYGDGRRWRDIYNLNTNLIQKPDEIRPGWILLLPD